jgi:opacity protein-like surface antigen
LTNQTKSSQLPIVLSKATLVAAALVGIVGAVAWSADDIGFDESPAWASQELSTKGQLSPTTYHWDLGLEVSYMFYTKKSNSNARVDVDKVLELSEERADLGLLPVPAGSQDTVVGKPQDFWSLGMHFYRQIGPALSVGMIGGFGIDKKLQVLDQGQDIAAPMYAVDFTRRIFYVAPSVKFGYWIQRVQPFVLGGFGWYSVRERTQATLVWDPFNDASVGGPFTTSDNQSSYTGMHLGAGIDIHVGRNGTIGAQLLYHQIFKPGDSIAFASPGLRFSYLF